MKTEHFFAGGLLFLVMGAGVGWFSVYRVSPWPPQLNNVYPKNATFLGLDGKTVKISDFRGKYVVLHYIQPTCPADIGNAKSLSQQFERSSEGQKGNDPRIVWLEVLLSSEKNELPQLSDLYQWSNYMSEQRNFYNPIILAISSKLASSPYASATQQLHGFQLLDRQGVLRVDVTTNKPKHYWPAVVERLAYWLRTSSDAELPPTPTEIAEPTQVRD